MKRPRRLLPLGMLMFLAWRGLLQHPLIAILLCAAVTGGVAFQIPNDANLRGYEREILVQGVELGSGDVRVRPREGALFEDADALAAQLAARSSVIAAVPTLTLPGAIGVDGNFKSVLVLGVDASATRVPFRIVEGHPLSAGDGDAIVVGTSVAASGGMSVGDRVQLRVIFGGQGEGVDLDEDVGKYTMTVRGRSAGSFVVPQSVVVDLGFLRDELAEPHAASVILVHLADHGDARSEARRIEHDFPTVEARAWQDDSTFLENALAGADAVGFVSRTMVVLAVLVPVWALLYVHVLHRQREIGILGAIGLRRADVFFVYLAQAACVGIVGVAIGCAAGYGLVRWFAEHPIFESPDFVIRPVVSLATFAIPSLVVLGATLLAGVFPAWRAARIDPAQTLQGRT